MRGPDGAGNIINSLGMVDNSYRYVVSSSVRLGFVSAIRYAISRMYCAHSDLMFSILIRIFRPRAHTDDVSAAWCKP